MDAVAAAAAAVVVAAVGRMIHRGWEAPQVASAAEEVCLEMPHLQVVTRSPLAFVPTDQRDEAEFVDIEMIPFHLNASAAALMLPCDQECPIQQDAEMSPVGLFFQVLERFHPYLLLQEASPI